MTGQKLVDELEKALTDEAYDGGMGAMSPEEFRELVRTLAVTAAKVVDELRASPTLEQRHASHGHAGSYCMPAPPPAAGFGVGAEFSAEVNQLEGGHDECPSQRGPALGGTRVEGRQGQQELEEGLDEVSVGEEAMSEHAPSMRVTSEGSLLVRLANALEAAEKAHTPTDDERAIFDAIAGRLGEHSQVRNYEIADSGEYETKLRGPVDVEVLAEWLLPTVLGFRRSEVPEPSDESVPCPECGQPRPFGLDFMCLDCNGVRYVSENDWYAHHGCGFEEEWKYQREAREAIAEHLASCDWSEPQGKPSDAQEAVRRLKEAGVGSYMILAAVTKVYDMETKS